MRIIPWRITWSRGMLTSGRKRVMPGWPEEQRLRVQWLIKGRTHVNMISTVDTKAVVA